MIISSLIVVTIIFLSTSVIPSVRAADKAPDFNIEVVGGQSFTLSEHRGEIIVLDFMTPLCLTCKELEKNLQEVYQEYSDEATFITIDVSSSSIEELEEYKENRDIPWLLGKGNEQIFVDKYKGTSVPMLVIIDEEGYITFKRDGLTGKNRIESELDQTISGTNERVDLQTYGIYGLAVIGGFVSFFSPCAFPLLPSYIAFYLRPEKGKNESSKYDGVSLGLKAAGGIVLVFGVLGIIAVSGGRWISNYIPYLEPIIGMIVIILGILLISEIDIGAYLTVFLSKIKSKLDIETRSSSSNSPFFYGLGYGATAAGCTFPVFLAVVMSSWLSEGYTGAITVLALYLLTMAALMLGFSIVTAFFRDKIVNRMRKGMRWINKIAGLILLVVGIYLVYTFINTL